MKISSPQQFLFLSILFLFCNCHKEKSVAPADPTPTLTTSVAEIDATEATLGGIITNAGQSAVTARGVCWSESPAPTIDLITKTLEGTGTGSFSSSISGLTEGTTYHVRAYATNSYGTAYGNEILFKAISPFFALDNAIMEKMTLYKIPGLSIAVVKSDNLVHVRSFGYSDKEANTVATNTDRYRIASISKPITMVAILKLVADGRISLDQKVFGPGSILGSDFGDIPVGSDIRLITVRHLLDQKSGWTNNFGDPMFWDNSFTQADLISNLIANRPLDYFPGTTYYYLNFGYCILGRVIEKITNQAYADYVKTNILNKCGISDMQIGGNTLSDRVPKEVKYYQRDYDPYSMNVERMDAHGGWIATATDLARFMVKGDQISGPDELIPFSLLSQFYLGERTWNFFGSLPGTSAIVSKQSNFSFVLLANTRGESNPDAELNDLYDVMLRQLFLMDVWPSKDLF